MAKQEHNRCQGLKIILATALLATLIAVPALSFAGPKVIVVKPRIRPKAPKIVVVPRAHRHKRVIKVLPGGYKTGVVNGVRYHYHKGVFYKAGSGGYVVVKAPLGFRLKVLPSGFTKIRVGSRIYFYHQGTYFRWNSGKQAYAVVSAPRGAVIANLPSGYSRVNIQGDVYYKYNGVYYRQEELHGKTVYVVTEI